MYDIRSELYDLRNLIVEWKNNHLADKDLPRPHDSRMCHVCQAREGQLSAIDLAIRRFGGSPRR